MTNSSIGTSNRWRLAVDDTEIVGQLKAPIEDVRRQLDILADQGYTKEANTFGGHSAYIAPKGMATAEQLREQIERRPTTRPHIGFE